MSEKPVQVEGLGKCYALGEARGIEGYQRLTEAISERFKRTERRGPRESFWALRDINFELKAGEKYAVIGHNGAGKSTLLKILSRVVVPTEGRAHLRGRVGALVEVGTGFHPELTGRENVFLNGALLGMRRAEIAAKFDEIVDFSDVTRFIDTPVKRYSSGMMLRLAFSVSAHLEAEILIVDEVLSVGDLAFQEKCLGRMKEAAGEGRTVLFVSHNLTAVQGLCTRAMLLSGGRMIAEGPTPEIIQEYVRGVRATAGTDLSARVDRQGSEALRFQSIHFEAGGRVIDSPISGRDLDVVLSYETANRKPLKNVNFAISILTHLDEVMIHLSSEAAGVPFAELPPSGQIRCRIPRLPLPTGQYLINLWSDIGGQPVDWVTGVCELTVAQGDFFGSGREIPVSHRSVLVDHGWEVSDQGPGEVPASQAAEQPAPAAVASAETPDIGGDS